MSRARVAAAVSCLALLAGGCGGDEETAGEGDRQPVLSQSPS